MFHDGSPVTTDDVEFSFARVLDPANKSLYATFIAFVDSVTKKDDKTVTIKLKQPFSLVAERLSVVKIVPKAAVEADAKAFDANPIGSGPYKMTDNSATSQKLVFEKFDDYNGPRPAKAAKMWKVMPDDATRTNALTSKAVQAIDLVPDLSIETLKASSAVESVQGFALLFAMFNCGSAPFNNVKNRQAFLYALDMEKVVKTAYLGNATPASSFLQETHPSYKKAKNVYSLDVAKAKALFAETGLKSIRLLCTDHGWVKKATPIIKESLEAAGLDRRLHREEVGRRLQHDRRQARGLRRRHRPRRPLGLRGRRRPAAALVVRRRHLDRQAHALEGPGLLHQGAGRCSTTPSSHRRRPEGHVGHEIFDLVSETCRCTRCSTASRPPATTRRR